jgi:hypothetical protein
MPQAGQSTAAKPCPEANPCTAIASNAACGSQNSAAAPCTTPPASGDAKACNGERGAWLGHSLVSCIFSIY